MSVTHVHLQLLWVSCVRNSAYSFYADPFDLQVFLTWSEDVHVVWIWSSGVVWDCLFVLRLNVPVNNFSVMSGRSHRFLGNKPVLSGSKVSCSRTQHGGGRFRTPDLSLWDWKWAKFFYKQQLWPLIDVNMFFLNIFRTNGWILILFLYMHRHI